MKETIRVAVVVSFAVVLSMIGEHALAAPPANHETVRVRHHRLFGSVIPNLTDAPHGIPGEWYGCLSCHEIDASSGTNHFLVERDCQVCHCPLGATTALVDLNPGSDRNLFNLKSRGVLPVSILNSDDYSVSEMEARGWNTGSGQRLHPRGASLVAEAAPATVKPVHSERY